MGKYQEECNYQTALINTNAALEAAKQRELELLAVIEKQRDMLAEADLWLDYLQPSSLPDEHKRRAFDEFLCDIEPIILCDLDPSQALREHEAKLLEEAAEMFKSLSCFQEAKILRNMAEERRNVTSPAP